MNYILIRIHLLIMSPIIPWLIGFIILTLYKINYDSLLLCDGNDTALCDLKVHLTNEAFQYRTFNVQHDYYSDLRHQLMTKPISNDRNNLDQIYYNSIKDLQSKMADSSNRATQLVNSIKALEPSFNWTLQYIKHPYIAYADGN